MANKLAWLACTLLAVTACSNSSLARQDGGHYTILYRSAWHAGIDPRLTIQAPRPDAIATVAMPQFHGVALKATMRRADDFTHVANGTPRAEVVFARDAHFAVGKDYEVRWSTMIPPAYRLDSQQPEIITQLHQSGFTGSPPFALMLSGGHYQVDVRGGAGTPSQSYTFGTPAADAGRVVTWRLHYRPDDQGTRALTDLYKDGVRVVHSMGRPNAYPGDQNAYLKIGIYKWWWQTRPSDVDERTMYYGDVEIAEQVPNSLP
ncbi:heparin lyase I family protein [Paraburkholderia sp. BCC1884]|uniref:heparin lyase I family protein n=1 Tax=Paraburkholderia sp. BCC1884 TaxID=2562668 RepID=UPI001183C9A4|nr:heparin lyase I family protein [Paraburkholderia sp. BCC1884]